MKKVSLLALAATLATAQGASADLGAAITGTCPKAFQGFFVGGNIGYGVGTGSLRHATKRTDAFTAIDESTEVESSETEYSYRGSRSRLGVRGVDGGINTGYTHRFGNWGLGLEFVASWANSDGKNKRFSTIRDTVNGQVTDYHHNYSQARVRLRNSLQLRGNFSYIVCNLWAPKVILGWDNSRWTQNHKFADVSHLGESTVAFSRSKSKRYNGFLWGLGVDFLATKHVIVGFEYTGTTAGKKSLSHTRIVHGATYTSRGSWKPQYNKFALTAKVIY